MSAKDTLNMADMKKWAKNTFIFSLPALIVLLTALKGGIDIRVALGATLQALLASTIDLLGKYKAGSSTTLTPQV